MGTKTTKVKEVDKEKKSTKKSKESAGSTYQVWNKKPPLHSRWKKWQSGNPKWSPLKGIALCNAELEKQGIVPATKAEIEANYMAMVNIDEATLDKIALDMTKPMLTRIVARNMKSGKGFDVIERMIDRAHGKAVQKEEIKHTGLIATTDASTMSSAELDKYIAGIAW